MRVTENFVVIIYFNSLKSAFIWKFNLHLSRKDETSLKFSFERLRISVIKLMKFDRKL